MPLKDEHVRLLLMMQQTDIMYHVAPPVICEICGTVLKTHANALNFAFTLQIGVPGSPLITPIHCPLPEHWACSIECWSKLVDKCKNEHMIPLMQAAHDRVGRDNISIAPPQGDSKESV